MAVRAYGLGFRVQGLGRVTLYPEMIYTEYGDGGGCFRVTIIAPLNLASAVASLTALLRWVLLPEKTVRSGTD